MEFDKDTVINIWWKPEKMCVGLAENWPLLHLNLLADLRMYIIYIFHLKFDQKLFLCIEEIQNTRTRTSKHYHKRFFWYCYSWVLNVKLLALETMN